MNIRPLEIPSPAAAFAPGGGCADGIAGRDEVAGRNSYLQRVRRMIWRLPHRLSGADLVLAGEPVEFGASGGAK